MTPTHVLFDTSPPPSPSGQSTRTSVSSSLNGSPARPQISLSEPQPPSSMPPLQPVRVMSPRLPTPMSDYSLPSSRSMTPTTTASEGSPLSPARPLPNLSASLAVPSSYNTPLGGSLVSEVGPAPAYTDPLLNPGSRVQSPFSDIYSVDARSSSPEYVPAPHSAGAPFASPRVQSPSIASDFTLDSDEEFDVLSPRSGMFSPSTRESHLDDDPFEVGSQHESEVSWASVGRRSPSPHL